MKPEYCYEKDLRRFHSIPSSHCSQRANIRFSVCLGTACYVKGSGEIFKTGRASWHHQRRTHSDGKFSLDSCRCVGACGLAPVMMINDEVYGRLTPDDIPGILAKYQ